MLTAEDRLRLFDRIVEDLISANEEMPVIVEGERDVRGLRSLGVHGTIIQINAGHTIVHLSEILAERYKSVIILTDWDRSGGRLARQLADALTASDVRCNLMLRKRFAHLTSREIKRVESLPSFRRHLALKVGLRHVNSRM